jgi:hypothetical protein
MFSQNSEESHILNHFSDNHTGRFLDIGTFDGRTFSNTHALALTGWSGVCVEPSPLPFSAAMTLYRDRPDIKLVNAAMSYKETGLVEFADSNGDAISTTSASHEERWKKIVTFQHIYVIFSYCKGYSEIHRNGENVILKKDG